MEQNLPIIAKKIWKMAKVIYFMLRKGISKGKLFSALNIMMKRGKIAGKEAIQNLIFHHAATSAAAAASGRREYEFNCGNKPSHIFHLPFHLHKRKNSGGGPTQEDLIAAASPALPGFGPSPIGRQLRITDSPFPVGDFEDSQHVDEAAEEFIIKFYKDLRQQNSLPYLSYS
ncbi:hypothetical protein PHJA_000709500 [Phtheirospermum japonicum]|uniref:Avr9/Cf-9 rapidly elicited protein 146 n=1 Tax=Phtheirospermum japonicum TaxID=374723 RepID=A0A830BKR5_9LAMI|nr:hypothetical protein PHJA_000709500 [Phtheirospermum japonicum]